MLNEKGVLAEYLWLIGGGVGSVRQHETVIGLRG